MDNIEKTKNSFLDFQIYDYSSLYQTVELVALSLLSFLLPIVMGHPQFLIGSMINLMLFRSALSMDFKRTLPVILLPSIGVVTAGVLFGGLTGFTMFFIPFIWVGNAIYVIVAKFVSYRVKDNYGLNVLLASSIKSGLLFTAAFFMVGLFGFPAVFLKAMGLLQFITGCIGGVSALLLTKAENFLLVRSSD